MARLDGDVGACTKTFLPGLADTVTTVAGSREALLYGIIFSNSQAAITFLQLFDKPTDVSVTLGTTTPYMILPMSVSQNGSVIFNKPVKFGNGIQAASTTTYNGLTAAAADYVLLTG